MTEINVGSRSAIEKKLVGHVDNSSYSAISVDIQMTLATPANAEEPVPVMMMFGGSFYPKVKNPEASKKRPIGLLGEDPPATEQLIAAGWGYAIINPWTIQDDNGADAHDKQDQQKPIEIS